jgi:hypothetical protein
VNDDYRLPEWLKAKVEAAPHAELALAKRPHDSAEIDWLARAEQVVAFVSDNSRVPSSRSRDVPEKRLSEWLNTQRQRYRNGRLTSDRRAFLDAKWPAWCDSLDDKWLVMAHDLQNFISSQRRLPMTNAQQGGAEQKLASWLSSQRSQKSNGSKNFTASRDEWLEENTPGWSAGFTDAWDEKLASLAVFCAVNSHLPRGGSGDAHEHELASWLGAQRSSAKSGKHALTEERRERLDSAAPGWGRPREDFWQRQVKEILAFQDRHGRLPKPSGTENDENRMAEWLVRHRNGERSSTGDRALYRYRLLDEVLPAWRGTGDGAWAESARAVKEYRERHGSWPSSKSADPVVRRMGTWLSGQRWSHSQGDAVFTPARKEYMDASLPEWAHTVEDEWRSNFGRLREFWNVNARWPRVGAQNPVEDSVGRWLRTQRGLARKPEHARFVVRRELLDEALPGWRGSTRDKCWQTSADALEAFFLNLGRWPVLSVTDKDERALATWLRAERVSAMRGAATHVSRARQEQLDRRCPGWRHAVDAVWVEKADAVGLHYETQAGWPRQSANTIEERRLATWLGTQRTSKGKQLLSDERHRYLDAVAPGWSVSSDDVWAITATKLYQFYATNSRWPSSASLDAGEVWLAAWLNTQRTASRKLKRGLKPARRDILDESVPGWDRSFDDLWALSVEATAEFWRREGR